MSYSAQYLQKLKGNQLQSKQNNITVLSTLYVMSGKCTSPVTCQSSKSQLSAVSYRLPSCLNLLRWVGSSLLWLLCGFSLFRKAGPLLCFLFHWTGNLTLLFCWIYYIGFRPTVLWYSGRIFTHNLLILVSSPMNTGFVGGVSLSSSKACAR